MFLRTIQFLRLHVKTLIKVFLLDLNANARMIWHAFLGRFQDELDIYSRRVIENLNF